jgi:hypothetical protein
MISEIVRPFGSGYRAGILVGFHHAAECLRLGGASICRRKFSREPIGRARLRRAAEPPPQSSSREPITERGAAVPTNSSSPKQ